MPAELVHGLHAVRAVLERDPAGVLELWVQDTRRDAAVQGILRRAHEHGIAVHRVPRKTVDRLGAGARHQGVIARYRAVQPAARLEFDELLDAVDSDTLLLALDRVQDPHNLGACLRSADAAGAAAVVVTRHHSAPVSAVVRRVACGAAESVPVVRVGNLARALHRLGEAGVRVIGLAGEAPASLYEVDLTGPVALVLGGEEHGLRRINRAPCHELVRIPMAGTVQSLNVSVAAALGLFEVRRRRGLRPGRH